MKTRRWNVPNATRAALMLEARQQRKSPTASEARLWQELRRKALGVRVRRQQPIGPYIVDFLIASRQLIIEVDGEVHGRQVNEDEVRQRNLEALGFRFVRVSAEEVMSDLDSVIRRIRQAVG